MTARSDDPSIISEADQRQAGDEYVLAEIEEFRKTMPRIRLEEILSARHEGHKY
jgi:hypothetical protein